MAYPNFYLRLAKYYAVEIMLKVYVNIYIIIALEYHGVVVVVVVVANNYVYFMIRNQCQS